MKPFNVQLSTEYKIGDQTFVTKEELEKYIIFDYQNPFQDYDKIEVLTSDLLKVTKNGKVGVIDKNGKEIVGFDFDDIEVLIEDYKEEYPDMIADDYAMTKEEEDIFNTDPELGSIWEDNLKDMINQKQKTKNK